MRPVVVGVWRGDYNVAVISATDEKFLNDFRRWIEKREDYELSFRDSKLGPEHQ
jgi:hypothetical protein